MGVPGEKGYGKLCPEWGRQDGRELAAPIEDVAAFAAVVDDVVTNNPFGCTAYQVGTENHAAVEKTRESYTGRVVYEDGKAVTVG